MPAPPRTCYLELSSAAGTPHKFYELVLQGTSVRIRWGRIGAVGQSLWPQFETVGLARAWMAEQVANKRKKGYRRAVPGAVRPRPVQAPDPRQLPLLPPKGPCP